ncbi:hypothetical protein HMPREF0201_00852 [Cedecea davisae DSM 4568]|uniref:Uncharacterized protein n=1 Tax=Cedecea davisae DSM 4568 TaxID=566551 RepID=S3K1P9_9ENTR|nr:hypothetical protein HMPREF0201_00852 [Cedecea davisae DSM 4568]
MLAAFSQLLIQTQQKFSFREPLRVRPLKSHAFKALKAPDVVRRSCCGSEIMQRDEIPCVKHFP